MKVLSFSPNKKVQTKKDSPWSKPFSPPSQISNHFTFLIIIHLPLVQFSPMAAISITHSFHSKYNKKNPRFHSPVSCQNRAQSSLKTKGEKEKEEIKGPLMVKLLVSVEKLVKGLKENLSPKQKGDWKDLVLMSLSFAVYVYISQKLVCAYCVWTSMLKQPW